MAQPMMWVALGYRLSSLPSRNRVYVWRRLKDFGAVYFESGVALLPMREKVLARLDELRTDILRFGGHATLANMQFLRREDDQALIRRFDDAVRVEYAEVERQFRALAETVASAREGRQTPPCGDTLLASLRRVCRLMGKIRERDYFNSAAGLETGESYRKAAASVQAYLTERPAAGSKAHKAAAR